MTPVDLEQFPISAAALRMLAMVSPIYDRSYVAKWLYEVIGQEMDEAREIVEALLDERFPETATWGIVYHEQRYHIAPDESLTLEERRARVIAKRGQRWPMNVARLEKYLTDITGRVVTAAEQNSIYTLWINVAMNEGLLDHDELLALVQRVKPSHIHANINDALTDDAGLPSVMVRVPKFNISDVIAGGSATVHPAFIVNGVEIPDIYVSKYRNVVRDSRAYSLLAEQPLNESVLGTASEYCTNKGAGWHCMTNAEWAAIALWCRANSCIPLGCNNYGKDVSESEYVAVPYSYTSDVPPKIREVLTGTGPVTWSHNGLSSGIWDLNGDGNYVTGYRTVGGEIQIIENNDAADTENDIGAGSSLWKAILEDGSLVAPGTADTLKWDYVDSKITLCTTITTQANVSRSTLFNQITKAAGITVPEILVALALYPADSGDHGSDIFRMNNGAGLEILALRSTTSSYAIGALSGVFSLGDHSRNAINTGTGIRANYYHKIEE